MFLRIFVFVSIILITQPKISTLLVISISEASFYNASSRDIIDLCSSEDTIEINESSSTDDVQVNTPHRRFEFNVVKDIQTAISIESFSAMYPDEIQHTEHTSTGPSCYVLTPLVLKDREN